MCVCVIAWCRFDPEIVIPLPRGGTSVRTSAGFVQFGLPPETIKDSMSMGLDVPCHFVIPQVSLPSRFNRSPDMTTDTNVNRVYLIEISVSMSLSLSSRPILISSFDKNK